MKKNWLSFAVVFVTIVGIALMAGCPSDADEGEKLVDPNIVLKMLSEPAQYKAPVTNLLFEEGKTYVVTLAVTNIDEALVGGFFGGVLLYEPGEEEDAVRVSEWAHSASGEIIRGAKSYKWEFKATKSTPSEMQNKQYFELMAQNSSKSNFKDTDVFGIKGTISVSEKGAIDEANYVVTTITTTPGQNTVVSIQGEEYTKVSAAKSKTGSFLRLYVVTKTGNIGKIGPDKGTGTFLDLNSNSEGIIDIDLAELFTVNTSEYNYININIWSPTNPADGLTKVELWDPK
jgi:hypothetical protein